MLHDLDLAEIAVNCDIESVSLEPTGRLTITIAQALLPQGRHGVRVSFEKIIGMQMLDEIYFLRFQDARSDAVHPHVLKIHSGGWRDEIFKLSDLECSAQEWIIRTGMLCMSVFSYHEPTFENVLLTPLFESERLAKSPRPPN
jgi:hypothetical protein